MRGFLNKNQRQKQINSRLKNENNKLRETIKDQNVRIKNLENNFEQALLYVEELQRIIFGKMKKKDKGKDEGNKDDDKEKKEPKKRDPLSYRRPTPKEDEVTDCRECHIDNCPDCGSQLTDFNVVVRYIEDILPLSRWYQALKTVTKKFVTTGYCSKCRKRVSAEPLGKQTVSIGRNIRKFVAFSNIILRLSYSQISDFLNGTVRFNISDGEIANILKTESVELRPEYAGLIGNIRGQPGAHYDETGWKLQKVGKTGGNYAWVMAGAENNNAVFLLGRNRGKGNAKELQGKNNDQTGITDDYGAYKNMFTKHGLCWSHPDRKFRDLKNSGSLGGAKKENCKNTYELFTELYRDVRTITAEPFVKKKREKAKKRLMKRFEKIIILDDNDPIKLKKIKARLLEQKECYFVCVTEPGIPPDNNKAERALRHLVIKRKWGQS